MSDYNTKQIDVDIDVHRVIEGARISFDEDPNDILRRLLGIDAAPTQIQTAAAQAGEGWYYGGVFLPNGTNLYMTYNGANYSAAIANGKLLAYGHTYKSLSGAASALTNQSLNGWNYWHVQRPTDSHYIQADQLRRQEKVLR